MDILKNLKELSDYSKKRKAKKEQRKKEVNQNPTEEELKNNKNGKLSFLFTFISIVVYILGFGVVAMGFEENFAVGIISLLFVLMITPLVQRKAISLAQKQRKINGKGLFALICAYILPLAVLAGGFFFFITGGYYLYLQ